MHMFPAAAAGSSSLAPTLLQDATVRVDLHSPAPPLRLQSQPNCSLMTRSFVQVLRIAANHNSSGMLPKQCCMPIACDILLSAAQVLLAWVWSHRVPAAVRSCNTAHMQDNAASPLIQVAMMHC